MLKKKKTSERFSYVVGFSIHGHTPKRFLDDLGPEDLLLVQVDSAVTVPHPVWPRVRRDVLRLSCAQKREEEEGESEQLLFGQEP